MASLADERMSAIHLLRAGQTVSVVASSLAAVNVGCANGGSGTRLRRGPGSLNNPVPRTECHASYRPRCGSRSSWCAAPGGASRNRHRLEVHRGTGCPHPAQGPRLPAAAQHRQHRASAAGGRDDPTPPAGGPRRGGLSHLQPTAPQQLCQVDIVPHYLTGGTRVPCFNAIDVVSRCATGMAYEERRAKKHVPSPCRSGRPWGSLLHSVRQRQLLRWWPYASPCSGSACAFSSGGRYRSALLAGATS